MNSVDVSYGGLAMHAWLLLLGFTAGVLLVVVLRRPCRRAFGTECAFLLWWLPPVAMVASQWPHTASAATGLPSLVYAITSAGGVLASPGDVSAAAGHVVGWLAVWLGGALLVALTMVFAQWRYRRRLAGALPLADAGVRWPVWRASRSDVGPALVGAWRVCIVLPADFEQRYDPVERKLILAHEAAHARRGDGWWCLVAQVVAAALWFHPLAWLALGALRRDQELACDARVLREHGGLRRTYVNAMLKTQAVALALPVGCAWSPRHPLAERIAMLKQPSPSVSRRVVGIGAGSMLAVALAGSIHATSAPLRKQPASTVARVYQLDMNIEVASDDGHQRRAEPSRLALCMGPGQLATVRTRGWSVEATTVPVGDGELRVHLTLDGKDRRLIAASELQGAPGQPLHAAGKGMDGRHTYVFTVTPQIGCPARTSAGKQYVSEHLRNVPARQAAETLAAKAGFELVNPQLLTMAPVSFDFRDVPGDRAMHLIAEVAGVKAMIRGRQVRFVRE